MEGDAILDADMLWNSVAVNANKLERVNTRGLVLCSQVKIDMVNDFTSLSEYKSAVSWRNSTNTSWWGNYSERKGCTRQMFGWLHQILAAQPHWLQWTVQTRTSIAKSSYLSSNFWIDALFFCFMALGSATDWLSIYFVALTSVLISDRIDLRASWYAKFASEFEKETNHIIQTIQTWSKATNMVVGAFWLVSVCKRAR
jgi:hypothetical protein